MWDQVVSCESQIWMIDEYRQFFEMNIFISLTYLGCVLVSQANRSQKRYFSCPFCKRRIIHTISNLSTHRACIVLCRRVGGILHKEVISSQISH